MAPMRPTSKTERTRRFLKGGGVVREDSDDELGYDDLPWEWIYEETEGDAAKEANTKKRKAPSADPERKIVGARMGSFQCRIGDTVLLKGETGEAWVGIICLFRYDEFEDEKVANFMWFSTPREIRNKIKRRTDFLENEIYITHAFDDNPLATINGKAYVVSKETFDSKYPNGKVPRSSRDYGKIFVCRRGCNTRTATYTEEFKWEDVYSGLQDLLPLADLIRSQTKETRKRKVKAAQDTDDFVLPDDDGDRDVPRTPKKRKTSGPSTPSKRASLTPRKFVTPTHKRIVVKKPLEYTPLGTRILSPSVLSSPYQLARSHLHVSSVPASLPCREEEFASVYAQLEAAITAGTGSCIYISGTPGTGKTATVREVVAQLNAAVQAEELDDFIFVEINGMKVTDPHQSYALLWEALRGDRVSPAHALELLEREFSSPSPRRVPCVVLMDELDQLVTKNQSVMYNFFNWPGLRHSRLIVLAVANTMDLPERTLSNKISSRLGLSRITFPGYTHSQLQTIITSRLSLVPHALVHPDAIQFAARKVAAVSGDARRALDICRRAVELAESTSLSQSSAANDNDDGDDASLPNTPSKTGRGVSKPATTRSRQKGQAGGKTDPPAVTIATIKKAIAEATASPLAAHLRALPLAAKLFLAALLARARRAGVAEVGLGDVVDEAGRMARMGGVSAEVEGLAMGLGLASGVGTRDSVGGRGGMGRKPIIIGATTMVPSSAAVAAKGARVPGLGGAVASLLEAGIVGVETRRGERVGRVRLAVGDEDVRSALKDDDAVRGLGFGS